MAPRLTICWLSRNPIDLAGVGTDTFVSGVSRVRGSEFDDVITGNGGNNILEGQGGNDILNGRGGNDTLTGGTGSEYLFTIPMGPTVIPPSNNDTITDFNDSEGDRIDLRGVIGESTTFRWTFWRMSPGWQSRYTIQIDASDSLTLNRCRISSLQASDFIFNGQVAITVQTPDGYNFGTLYDDMAGSIGTVTAVDGSHFHRHQSARGPRLQHDQSAGYHQPAIR